MFGYVKPCIPELKVKESEIYKAVYCTLCRELGKSFGIAARLTLSYDFTFLALIRLSTAPGCTGFIQKACMFNPLKKCNYCKHTGDYLEPIAAAGVIMMYYKLLDNIADSGFFKKIGYSLIRPFFASPHKKAIKKFPKIEKAVSKYIKQQMIVENEKSDSIDSASAPTAEALSYIFSLCADDENDVRVLERMGYLSGKWIYLIDALDDVENDRADGNYNVLLNLDENDSDAKKRIIANLNVCIGEMGKCVDLLKIQRYKEIIQNVVYLGLPDAQKKVLDKKEKNR